MPLITHAPEMALALEQAERSVAASGRALVAGDPQQLHAAALELQDSAHALALVLRGVDGASALGGADTRQRLVRVARDLALQREALLRRSAVVEQSLHSLVPQTRAPTYGAALARYARGAGKLATFGSA